MSEIKKNIELTNGWILCPSKSFPGKFYYFNVLNGETAWSLNQADNQGVKKESCFHKITDKSHGYPEPKTLPDETTPITQNNFTNTQRPQFLQQQIPNTAQLPTFGQVIFPKYVANAEPLIPNIGWISVPFPMFCPERKTMFDKVTQISDFERDFFAKSTNIPLCERFKNYESPILSFDTKNKTANLLPTYETSTPKYSFQVCVPESQNVIPKPLIKEPALKLAPKLPTPNIPIVFNSNEEPIINVSSTVENSKPSAEVHNQDKDQDLNKLKSSDLRFLLLAKRKSLETTDAALERKKPKPSESKSLTLKEKVQFNLSSETDDTTIDKNQEDVPTSNQTQTVDTPGLLKDRTTTFLIKDISKAPPPHVKEQPTFLPAAVNKPPSPNQRPTYKNTTWYIVVDTDVLLLDYELIDKIVLSDPKCRLVIPFAVAADIEALCLGDCHGQQRVIHARQLTRKLVAPPPHYIVEPRTLDNGSLEVTTESILQCCMKAANKNYYVVLLTNDPHLKMRATLQNIPSYKLNEIKYGANIKPTSESKNIQKNTSNNDFGTKNLFQQNLSLKNIQETTSQMKSMEITLKNDVRANNQYDQNLGLFDFRNPVKKQLFLSSDSETDNSDSDKLINITKPKCMKNIKYMTRPDSDGTSDISSEVSSLQLKDKNAFKPQNVGRNPFLPQNVKENGVGNFGLNPNCVFSATSFRKTIPNEKISKPDIEINEFQKDSLEYNFENTEKIFCSIPITNLKRFEPKSKAENSVTPNTSSLRQEPFGATRDSNTINPSQSRINKIINTVYTTTKTQSVNTTTTKDSTGIFKIPKLLPLKNATRNTSGQAESPTANDKIRRRTNIDSIDENLKRFRIKSKNMMVKIKTRIDEWTCRYMQIMEEALVNILEKNIVCMKNTVAPLTLKDTLNCIKMLYDSHTKIRDIINKLSQLLEKSMICVQGKLKLSIAPEDFMKIFGYGVLLVLSLKIILPDNEELKEAQLRLSALHTNLESTISEVDPELVKTPSVGCAENEQDQEEIRPPFLKKRSYVVDYLKKHFEQWATYKDDMDDCNTHKIENHTDFKVVRTCGKNLSLLKLDRRKTMTLSKNTIGDDSAIGSKDGPKLIRLLENNQIIKPDKTITIKTTNNEASTKLMGLANIENSQNDSKLTDKEKEVPLKKLVDNIEQENNIESELKEDLNYTTHDNSFLEENAEKDGPQILKNIKLIDEFENKKYLREPLDLDLLDYSEIYEPSINENVDFDILSEKSKKSEEITNFDENNFGLTETVCAIDDLFITPSVSPESKNTEHFTNKNNSEHNTSYNFNSVSENNNSNAHIQEKTEKNSNEVESETFTENEDSFNGNDDSKTHVGNFETLRETSETPNCDSGTHLDNSESHTLERTAEIVQDASTNDSGFENDSTYAHSMIKIFFHELSTTFKAIHSFVTNFIEEIHETELSERRIDVLHHQASKTLEDMVAIIQQLKCIIERESADDTVLKRLLRHAGVEASTDKRATRYRQIVVKCLEQSIILENALKIIVTTTRGDFEALPMNAETINSDLRYSNIFE